MVSTESLGIPLYLTYKVEQRVLPKPPEEPGFGVEPLKSTSGVRPSSSGDSVVISPAARTQVKISQAENPTPFQQTTEELKKPPSTPGPGSFVDAQA